MSRPALAILTLIIFSMSPAAALDRAPVAVSPGSGASFVEIAYRCPAFSWGEVEGAQAYELAVYRLSEGAGEESPPQAGLQGFGEMRSVLQKKLPGGATSWTPSLDLCLERGGRYAWTVRALGKDGESDWSEARLFTLSTAPTAGDVQEALRLLQQYVANGGTLEGLEPTETATSEPESPIQPIAPGRAPAEATATLTGSAAIYSEQPDATGETYGVYGTTQSTTEGSLGVVGEATGTSGEVYGIGGLTASPNGAGVVAFNTADGPDLILASTEDSARLTEAGFDRSADTDLTFQFQNSGTGSMTVKVDGTDVVTTATDKDTLGALGTPACDPGDLAKWSGSLWDCGDDLDTNNTYSNGFGLGLSAGTQFWVNEAVIQRRVVTPCPEGESIRVVNQDGSVTCEVDDDTTYAPGSGMVLDNGVISIDPAAFSTHIHAVDTTDSAGHGSSIAIGTDGMPLISYFDYDGGYLKVAHCEDLACSSASIATLDTSGRVRASSSIAIGADGLGLIAYGDAAWQDIWVAHCVDVVCSSADLSPLNSSLGDAPDPSIAIGSDGFGLIAYYHKSADALKVAHCTNASCSSADISVVSYPYSLEAYPSIALGDDGLGLISYQAGEGTLGGTETLEVAHCDNAACTSATTTTLEDVGNPGVVGEFTSIAIGADGLGLISYQGETGDLKVAHCTNSACTSADIVTVDTLGSDVSAQVRHTSTAIGADGLGLIAYYVNTSSSSHIKVARCLNSSCSFAATAELEYVGLIRSDLSVAIGADDRAIISYDAVTLGDYLRVAHLGIGVP